MRFMKPFGVSFLVILASFVFAQVAQASYDLEVTNVELVPCIQELDLDAEIYSLYVNSVYEKEVMDISTYPQYSDYLAGEWDDNYQMVEVADDASWFTYNELDSNAMGIPEYTVVCLAIDFTGNGNFEDFGYGDTDSVPTSWSDFLDFVPQQFSVGAVFVPSTGMNEHTLTPYFYQSSGPKFLTHYVESSNRVFTSVKLYGQFFEPNDSFGVIAAVDGGFYDASGMFYRPFFGGITHYNYGPTVEESDETNNYLYVEDLFSADMEHLSAIENLTIIDSDSDSFMVEWDPVDGVDHYYVLQYREALDSITIEQEVTYSEQTETFFEASLDGSDNVVDCVWVAPIDSNGVIGNASDDICFGELFSDVDDGLWYSDYTLNATQNGLISGYLDAEGNYTGVFGPADTITTSQALKMISILAHRVINPDSFAFELPYSLPGDLESHWASEYILTADIIGYDLVSDIDSFDPDRNITRAEIVNLIMDAMDADVPSYSTYSLSDIEGTPYANEIQLAYDLGIVSGYDGGDEFGPDNSLLRAEAVKIFVEAGHAFQAIWPEYEF